jgi:CBS domain-containing protein
MPELQGVSAPRQEARLVRRIEENTSARGRTEQLTSLLQDVRDLVPHALSLATPLGRKFRRRVKTYAPGDSLAQVLHVMEDQDFSQVVVRDGERLFLVTQAGILQWIVDRNRRGGPSPLDATMGDALRAEADERFRVLGGESTVLDAVSAFIEAPTLYAVILTESGDPAEAPIGILTPWDLVEVGGEGR